jgi:hypothetical protein
VNNVHGTIMVKAHREKDLYLLNVNVWKENANVASVAKFVSIRCILALATIETWRFIKWTSKLHFSIEQPKGFTHLICKLHKSCMGWNNLQGLGTKS